MSGRPDKKAGKKWMLIAGVLSCLAGVMWIVSWYFSRRVVFLSIGAMFFCIGGMWMAIGYSFQKRERNGKAIGEM
jgi:uncharacterized membrane protein HdeD (DUF308 family)